jgi:hypothetical protein
MTSFDLGAVLPHREFPVARHHEGTSGEPPPEQQTINDWLSTPHCVSASGMDVGAPKTTHLA